MHFTLKRLFLINNLLTAILPMLIIGTISIYVLKSNLTAEMDRNAAVLARTLGGEITTYMGEPTSTFNVLTRHLSLQHHREKELSEYFDLLVRSYDYLDALYLIDAAGMVREASFNDSKEKREDDYRGMDFSTVEICRRAQRESRLQWEPSVSFVSGEPIVSFCMPFLDGTVLANIRLAELGSIINAASKDMFTAFIVDKSGLIISHPDREIAGQKINIGNIPLIRAGIAGRELTDNFVFRSVSYRGTALPLPAFGWTVVVARDMRVAMQPVKTMLLVFANGMLSVLLLTFFIGYLSTSVLNRPFAVLTENARKVIAEEYDSIQDVPSHCTEIRILSETFGHMAHAIRNREELLNAQTEELMSTEEMLRELNQHLEERVVERTEKLQEATEELQTLNRNLVQRTLSLEDANKQLESFAYSISHDLRAPLRHIASFAAILAAEHAAQLDETGHGYLQRIGKGCSRMEELIAAILGFSQVARQPVKKEKIDVEQVIRELMIELQDEQDGRSVELVIGHFPPCMADPLLFRQVMANLLGNALKYTRQRETARIEVGASRENDEVLFFVRDNGAGFDMQYADRLFGVFQRFHRQEEFEGTGVGLAIVRSIIQRHGGRIWAESAPDRGATFYFTLPD